MVAVGFGKAQTAKGDVLTAPYFRSHMPVEWRATYEDQLRAAQEFAQARSRDIKPVVWSGPA